MTSQGSSKDDQSHMHAAKPDVTVIRSIVQPAFWHEEVSLKEGANERVQWASNR